MSIDPKSLGPAAQRQILEKLGEQARRKESKYYNQSDTRGSIRFDSKKEARRYDELMLMLKAGEIRNLKLQPQFTLVEAYTTPEGKRVRAMRYVADFSYERRIEKTGKSNFERYDEFGRPVFGYYWEAVVEDVKSRATKTREYRMKKKLLRERFGIEITEVE